MINNHINETLDIQIVDLFDPNLQEAELINCLSKKHFRKIGEGFSAHIFGATDGTVVLKIFPLLNIGNPESIDFINKSFFLKNAQALTERFRKYSLVRWFRQKVKLIIAIYRSANNAEVSCRSAELSIKGYEICINRGITEKIPTKIITNCFSKLSINTDKVLKKYFAMAEQIVLQKRFSENDLLINIISNFAQKGEISKCKEYIQDAIDYQVFLWRLGVADTDMSFNIFENLIRLPCGKLQIHDANDITDSKSAALWFVREKEKDINNIFNIMNKQNIVQYIKKNNHAGICETARKLYSILPRQSRNCLVAFFLNLSREILNEKKMSKNWCKDIHKNAR